MQARVKADSQLNNVTSCVGVRFFKTEWTRVPAWAEAEAERNPYLETRGAAEPKPVIEETQPEPATDEEPPAPVAEEKEPPKPPARRRATRRKP